MKNSKVFTLLAGLPDKQVKQVANTLKNHKRKTLLVLFNALEKAIPAGEEPPSEELYKKVFGKKYEKAKDYLLRNEYRLLYDETIELLIGIYQAEEAESQKAMYFLKNMLHYGIAEIFEDELAAEWKKAEERDDIAHLLVLSDLKLNYLLSGKIQALASTKEIAELSAKRVELWQQHALREIRKDEVKLKMAERLLRVYQQDYTPSQPVQYIDLAKLEETDTFAQYLTIRARVNFVSGQQKIDLLLKLFKEPGIIQKYEPSPGEATGRFLVNLAQEYYLLGDHTNAIKYYRQATEHIKHFPLTAKEGLAYNYTLALIRNKQFSEAKRLADEHAEVLLNSKMVGGRSPFLFAVLNIFAGNADEAEKYIQLETKKDGSEFYHFMRLCLAIVYYLRKDYDLALRESVNLDQAVNYELNREATLQTHISKPIIAYFKKFYTLLQARMPADELKEALKKLSEDVRGENLENPASQMPDSVLVQWMLLEIDTLLAKAKK
jgi:hypothetical protein